MEKMQRRFKLNGHPGVHVLLCWKMNPSVDTSPQSRLFASKASVFELMEGEYMVKLKRRSLVIEPPPAAALHVTPAQAAAANTSGSTTATPSSPTGGKATPAPAKRRKLSVLGAMTQFKTPAAENCTAVEDQIASEISKFKAIEQTSCNEEKYMVGGFF